MTPTRAVSTIVGRMMRRADTTEALPQLPPSLASIHFSAYTRR